MTGQALKGVRVLVAEDEYLMADALCGELQTSGAQIIGPVAQMEAALSLAPGDNIDAAALDINLGRAKPIPSPTCLRHAVCRSYSRQAMTCSPFRCGMPAC